MIAGHDLAPVATVLKTHGVHGELNCELDIDSDGLSALPCLFARLDGLMVPFFIRSLRPRGSHGALISFEDVCDSRAGALVGATLYAETRYLDEDEEDSDDGFYLEDTIGWEVYSDGRLVGTVTDYDDSTANVLLKVTTPDGREIAIPAADEFFSEVDDHTRRLVMELPEGLLDINV